jgi:hypothetical protein
MEIYKDIECTDYTRRCVVHGGKQYGFAHAVENDEGFDEQTDWSMYSTNDYDLSEDRWELI